MSGEEDTGLGLGLNSLFEEDDNAVDETIAEELAAEEAEDDISWDAAFAEQEEVSDAVAETPNVESREEPKKTFSSTLHRVSSAIEEHINSNANSNEETSSTAEAGGDILSEVQTGRIQNVLPIENLYPSRFQPRKIFSDESLDELASSIKQYGVLQPLLVREDPENAGHYEIIAGERRWRASQRAQIHEVPVIELQLEELEAFKIALIENLQREDLDPIDEAMGYQKLLEDYGQTQEQLAEAVGKSRPHITNMVRLLSLPDDVQAFVGAGDLSMGHARSLVGLEDASDVAKQIVKKGLSVRQTEALVKKHKAGDVAPTPKTSAQKEEKSADTQALENDISNALGMNVSISSKDGKSGTLSVEFKSLDQLDEVLHRLAHFPGSRLHG